MLVIEHNLDVIKTADWLIDLGPEGGNRGGLVVAEGTPEDIVKVEESHTGRFLAPILRVARCGSRWRRRAPRPRRLARSRRGRRSPRSGDDVGRQEDDTDGAGDQGTGQEDVAKKTAPRSRRSRRPSPRRRWPARHSPRRRRHEGGGHEECGEEHGQEGGSAVASTRAAIEPNGRLAVCRDDTCCVGAGITACATRVRAVRSPRPGDSQRVDLPSLQPLPTFQGAHDGRL